jgi:hypothetical protein
LYFRSISTDSLLDDTESFPQKVFSDLVPVEKRLLAFREQFPRRFPTKLRPKPIPDGKIFIQNGTILKRLPNYEAFMKKSRDYRSSALIHFFCDKLEQYCRQSLSNNCIRLIHSSMD